MDHKFSRWRYRVPILIGGICILFIYTLTSYRTIDWWFGSSYSLAAATLGVHSPPGSLLLTILGWLVGKLHLGISHAFKLNLFAGVLGAATCALLAYLAVELIWYSKNGTASSNVRTTVFPVTGVVLAVFSFAFSWTMWRYSVIFMPYVLTALFTVLIVLYAFKWWKAEKEDAGLQYLFVIMLLFGLDLSVHRTNLLILPGFLLWILICMPVVYRKASRWIAGGAGLIAGGAFHLFILPMAGKDPAINFGDPSTWSRFYYYISLKQYGGSWLVNMWPRKAPFLTTQVSNYISNVAENFFSYGKIMGIVFVLFCITGIITIIRREWRLMLGLGLIFLCTSLGAVVYFNLPPDYMYPMDRHYIPSFVIIALLASVGAGSILHYMARLTSRLYTTAVAAVLLIILSMPFTQIAKNYRRVDGSRSYFAYDFADNILSTVKPGAIVIVQGDNLWPIQYLQDVEGVRPDVAVLSLSLLNTDWYLEHIREHFPDLPLKSIDQHPRPIPWQETVITTKIGAPLDIYQLPDNLAVTDTFDLVVPPSVPDGFLLVQDQVIAGMIENNQWRRPIYFNHPLGWLRDHLRLEGLVWLLVPEQKVSPNVEHLRENLIERYSYRGYNDPDILVSHFTQLNGYNLQVALYHLSQYQKERGDRKACLEAINALKTRVPLERIEPAPQIRESIDSACHPHQLITE